MKVGDLVTFTPDWGTPIEDRPRYIVVREPYEISTSMTMVDIMIPGSLDIYATSPETLELLSESR